MPSRTSQHQLTPQGASPAGTMAYLLGDFYFYIERDELVHAKTEHADKLEPKVAELLRLFIRHQGEVLSQTFIQNTLWPDTVVEQNSLYQLLTKLRRLLNDASRQPIYIKTVPKKGYCLLVKVTELNVQPVASAETLPTTPHDSLNSLPLNAVKHLPHAQIKRTSNDRFFQRSNISFRWQSVLLITGLAIGGFQAIASYKRDNHFVSPTYQVQDVSYALGIEFDVDAHQTADLLVYVKDIRQLQVSDKAGQVLYQQQFSTRIAKPSWHPTERLLAFWRYTTDSCELNIISAQGAINHSAAPIPCTEVQKPVWKNSEELVLSIKDKAGFKPYLYRLATNELIEIPLKLSNDQLFISAIRAWNDDIYYLTRSNNHNSILLSQDGDIRMRWRFPVWLLAYNVTNNTIVTNDNGKNTALLAQQLDGQSYTVFTTAQGLFSSVSIDRQDDLYTSLEDWQVDIHDAQDRPIFSTSSIDYLPVSNALGETAFMSRRSGVCEVYLHSGNQVHRLSHYQGFAYVNFLEWRPDFSMLVSNRDTELVLYDRQDATTQFSSQANARLQNLGWINNEKLYSYDGESLRLYNLQGRLLYTQALVGNNLYFDASQQHWYLQRERQWLRIKPAGESGELVINPPLQSIAQLTAQQSHHIQNIRVRGNKLYWQSDWSKRDYIWSMELKAPYTINLVTEGDLIWHFDITPFQELIVARMDAIKGDIKRLRPNKLQNVNE